MREGNFTSIKLIIVERKAIYSAKKEEEGKIFIQA